MIMAAPGSRSEGLRMRELPVAMAMGMDQRGIMAGKLKLSVFAGVRGYFSARGRGERDERADGRSYTERNATSLRVHVL